MNFNEFLNRKKECKSIFFTNFIRSAEEYKLIYIQRYTHDAAFLTYRAVKIDKYLLINI